MTAVVLQGLLRKICYFTWPFFPWLTVFFTLYRNAFSHVHTRLLTWIFLNILKFVMSKIYLKWAGQGYIWKSLHIWPCWCFLQFHWSHFGSLRNRKGWGLGYRDILDRRDISSTRETESFLICKWHGRDFICVILKTCDMLNMHILRVCTTAM